MDRPVSQPGLQPLGGVYILNYSTARASFRSGDLIAQSHRASMFASWYDFKIAMVRMMCRSEYSHVGVIWVVAGRVFVLEAVQPCVRIYPLSKIGDFYHLPVNARWTKHVEEWAMEHVGTPYSQALAVAAFFGPVGHGKTTECALYATDVLRLAGVDVGPTATPTAVVRAAQLLGAPCTLITNPESPA